MTLYCFIIYTFIYKTNIVHSYLIFFFYKRTLFYEILSSIHLHEIYAGLTLLFNKLP